MYRLPSKGTRADDNSNLSMRRHYRYGGVAKRKAQQLRNEINYSRRRYDSVFNFEIESRRRRVAFGFEFVTQCASIGGHSVSIACTTKCTHRLERAQSARIVVPSTVAAFKLRFNYDLLYSFSPSQGDVLVQSYRRRNSNLLRSTWDDFARQVRAASLRIFSRRRRSEARHSWRTL